MDEKLMYTLLLVDGSHYIDQRAADRVETALRLNVDQFLIAAKVCGSSDPDRLVAVRTNDVVSLVRHATAPAPFAVVPLRGHNMPRVPRSRRLQSA